MARRASTGCDCQSISQHRLARHSCRESDSIASERSCITGNIGSLIVITRRRLVDSINRGHVA